MHVLLVSLLVSVFVCVCGGGVGVVGFEFFYLKAPTVAEGLKTISAPLTPYINQFCGWWRP